MSNVEPVCPSCGVDAEQVRDLREENAALRDEVARLAVQVKRFRGEPMRRLQQDQYYPAAIRVLEYWKARCASTARELGGVRAELAVARLRGGSTEQNLRRAVDGYAAFPYLVRGRRATTGSKDDWHADAKFIFRDAETVDRGIRMAEIVEQTERAFQAPAAVDEAALGEIGRAAVRYAQLGWQVFPCMPGEKRPATPNGLLNATVEVERISQYWLRVPDANVAVRTGQPSGIVVLDVDADKEGFASLRALERHYEPLPATLSCVTPRGGQHLYFRHPGVEVRNTQGVPGTGLDVRGDGGYVLAPPSMVNGKRYEPDEQVPIADMPGWLVQGLVAYQRRHGGATVIGPKIEKGQQHSTLVSLAGSMRRRGMGEEEIASALKVTNRTRLEEPAPDRNIDAIARSVCRYAPGDLGTDELAALLAAVTGGGQEA